MSELTKEHFDQQIGKLVTKDFLEEGFEKQAQIIALSFQAVQDDIGKLDKEIKQLREDIKALSSKLTNHLELSDKRYLELKYKNTVVAKWVKMIADKTGVPIDLAELEKF